MSKSNNLNSHHPESTNFRADKMSGSIKNFKKWYKRIFEKNHEDYQEDGKRSSKFWKRFYSKKRRQFLKNPKNYDKL